MSALTSSKALPKDLSLGKTPLFVTVGAPFSGDRLLARALGRLGVKIEAEDARAELAALNQRLLEAAGWDGTSPWPLADGALADVAAAPVRREALAWLAAQQDAASGPWAIDDIAVCRLLPLWRALFKEAGIRPIYLWVVRDPGEWVAEAAAAHRWPTDAAETIWFLRNAEIEKHLGREAAIVINHDAWRDPARAAQELIGHLLPFYKPKNAPDMEHTAPAPPGESAPLRMPLTRAFFAAICRRNLDGANQRDRGPDS